MTSTVEAKLRPQVSPHQLFANIFPCGSVTGAPKIRTMQIIGELEREPRNVYCGSIGFISPRGDAVFNVAIRTVLIDARTGWGEMGIGSGIVYDSLPAEEYGECLLKAKFLTSSPPAFHLIETMLWQPGDGYFLLDLHLARLKDSAAYFDFPYDEETMVELLEDKSKAFKSANRYRVRLLLDRNGRPAITATPLPSGEEMQVRRAALSWRRTSSSNMFLYHKTTNRTLYDAEYKDYAAREYFDVIFRNERDELTEGAISKLFIRKDGRFYTPPVSCGLLPGTFRSYLMDTSIPPVVEKVLSMEDLLAADEVYLANSVRGLVRVEVDLEGGIPLRRSTDEP